MTSLNNPPSRAASRASLSSLAEQTVVATAGASPLLQFNTPYNYMQTQGSDSIEKMSFSFSSKIAGFADSPNRSGTGQNRS